jgi:hypothetical protein
VKDFAWLVHLSYGRAASSRKKRSRRFSVTKQFITLSALSAASLLAQIDPKGIFVTPGDGGNSGGGSGNRPAVKYSMQLERGGEARPVAASYQFRDRDRFRFLFEVSQTSFVYFLHRQLNGDPDSMERYTGAKGISVVRDEDNRAPAPSGFTLLYPSNPSGVRLTARQPQRVPGNGDYFQLDTNPGVEKIVLVVSSQPLDMSGFVKKRSRTQPGGGSRNDSDNDVLGQLRKDIEAMDANTVTVNDQPSAKGICVGTCDGYSAPRNPGKPFLVNIDLRHYAASRNN